MNNTHQSFDNVQDHEEQTIVQFPTPSPVPSGTGSNAAMAKTSGNIAQTNGFAKHPFDHPNGQPSGLRFQKEFEPMPSLQTHTEWMTPVEDHVEIEPDVKEAGVESVPAAPHISLDEKNIGL